MATYLRRVSVLACLAAVLVYGAPSGDSAFPARQIPDPSPSLSGSISYAVPSPSETVPPASDDPNYPAYPPGSPGAAQPIRGNLGATILGPQNIPLQQQIPDILAPPTTDNGALCVLVALFIFNSASLPTLRPNAKWPFALSSNNLYTGGWYRGQNGEVSFKRKRSDML